MLKPMKTAALLAVPFSILWGSLCSADDSSSSPMGYPESNRQKLVLIDGWEFYLDYAAGGFEEQPPTSVKWEPVTVPHTPQLTGIDITQYSDNQYQLRFHRWVAWYKRDLAVDLKEGEKVYLEFEGAHQITKCWVNGSYVGEHSIGGYTPFHFDITDHVKTDGEANEVILSVDNRRNVDVPPDGDRYDYIKWSGLYRDVYLVVKDALHVGFPWEDKDSGVFITTPTVTAKDATISVRTNVKNTSEEEKLCRVVTRVIDDRGAVVLRFESEKTIGASSDYTFTQTGGIVENVRLWDIEDPYLYRVNTLVMDGDDNVDCVENPLGIRKFEFVDGKGFLLNGNEVELIGANRHQGMLFIGDAAPNSLHWKDAWQFKQAGFNSVRLAHYPHDDAFIEACDKLGILVFEEPPTWIGIGGERWLDNLEEATRRMVRNHRNHPSVLMWGAAINHRGPVERLHYACKEEDPTRPTASNGATWTSSRNSGVCDIYAPMDYENTPVLPYEFTYLCEHGGSSDASRAQFEVSKSKQMANMIGVALWTAHDYQAFKGRRLFNARRPWSIYRVPNPTYYWYQSEMLDTPMVYIADERASTDQEILVFSNCQRVELYQDGELIESRVPDRSPNLLHLDHPTITFRHQWTSGELTAKGYINDQLVAEDSLNTPKQPKRIRVEIELDEAPFFANGSDIKYIRAFIEDENGTTVLNADNEVRFKVEGDGWVIGGAEEGANPNKPYYGVASAMLRSGQKAGAIKVTASAKGLESGEATVDTVAYETNRILAEAKPIYDLKHERIDLCSSNVPTDADEGGLFEIGATSLSTVGHLLQFGWNAWMGDLDEQVVYESNVFEGCSLQLSATGSELNWYTNWGMVSENPYMAVDGVYAEPLAKMSLTIAGLEKGSYILKSWHHHRERLNRAPPSLRIAVSDSKGEGRVVEAALRLTSGSNIFSLPPASSEYRIHSDGKTPVSITFEGVADNVTVPLNGLTLSDAIPSE